MPGGKPIIVTDEEITEMVLFPMVNEACRVLDEGIVVQPSDLDVASVLGMSFPSYRGGIVYWAHTIGADNIYRRLNTLSEAYGNFFRPSNYLTEIAARCIPLEKLSFFLIELCLVEYEMLKYPPSFMAAAATYTAQASLYGIRQWNKTCQHHTGYSEDQLLECSRMMFVFHQLTGSGKLTGVHRKYNTSKFGYASRWEPAHFPVQIYDVMNNMGS